MAKHAVYKIVLDDGNKVVIRDLGPWDKHLTVTNDIEHVLKQLQVKHDLNERELYYHDSEGNYDQIVHLKGKFAGFAPAS